MKRTFFYLTIFCILLLMPAGCLAAVPDQAPAPQAASPDESSRAGSPAATGLPGTESAAGADAPYTLLSHKGIEKGISYVPVWLEVWLRSGNDAVAALADYAGYRCFVLERTLPDRESAERYAAAPEDAADLPSGAQKVTDWWISVSRADSTGTQTEFVVYVLYRAPASQAAPDSQAVPK